MRESVLFAKKGDSFRGWVVLKRPGYAAEFRPDCKFVETDSVIGNDKEALSGMAEAWRRCVFEIRKSGKSCVVSLEPS